MEVPARPKNSRIPFFREITGHNPFPWQTRLYIRFETGATPSALDIPTGLGKTSAALLYLIALSQGAPLPRRLVYVVDRRAIVDQSIVAIREWIERIAGIPALRNGLDALAAFPADVPVLSGVLRGGFADDGEWRTDPARPTIVVGTVDMVGSRLLFAGFGDGMSRRAQHAGLLGYDATLMLDEAHLSPGFASLTQQVADRQRESFGQGFRTCTLSATLDDDNVPFTLDADDMANPVVQARLHAIKDLHLYETENNAKRIEEMVGLATGIESGSVLVYLRSVAEARKVAKQLAKRLSKRSSALVGLLTGTLRGAERSALTQSEVWEAFLPKRMRTDGEPARYLVSTSAGEVGVDLDADHTVMDLAPFDALTQRLGRVNRCGLQASEMHLVYTKKEARAPEIKTNNKGEAKPPTPREGIERALHATLTIVRELPGASPAQLRAVVPAERRRASTPGAIPVPLRAQTIEVFAATTALPRSPPLDLFLRGMTDQPEIPETHLLWRWDVPELVRAGDVAAAEILGLYRPHPAELARVTVDAATEILAAARTRTSPLRILVRDAAGRFHALTLTPDDELPDLRYATLFLPTTAGGLAVGGLPDPASDAEAPDVADDEGRVRYVQESSGTGPLAPPWSAGATELRLPLHDTDDEDAEPRWLVYSVRRFDPTVQDADSDVTRLATSPQSVIEHVRRVGDAARRIAQALDLEADLVAALETAGAWHDAGKDRPPWQRAAGIPSGKPAMAKASKGRFNPRLLDGYRHEFGSMADAERALPAGRHLDLVLHLIAAHHGRARPGFPDPRNWDRDLPADIALEVARAVACRFGVLQGRFGPWRLAWMEALLKAADAWVSADRDQPEVKHG